MLVLIKLFDLITFIGWRICFLVREDIFVHQIVLPSNCDNDTHSSGIISCVKYYIVILLSDVNKCTRAFIRRSWMVPSRTHLHANLLNCFCISI